MLGVGLAESPAKFVVLTRFLICNCQTLHQLPGVPLPKRRSEVSEWLVGGVAGVGLGGGAGLGMQECDCVWSGASEPKQATHPAGLGPGPAPRSSGPRSGHL